jgi:hypothetical protein
VSLVIDLLWGPGRQQDLVADLWHYDDQEATDAVAFLDRLFYIRLAPGDSRPEFPRSAAHVLEFGLDDQAALWYVIRADFPMDAWVLVRDSAESLEHAPNFPGIVRRVVRRSSSAPVRAEGH